MAYDIGPSPYPLDSEMVEHGGLLKQAAKPSIYFDGVFKGDYSLAIVNRHLAEALIKVGCDLVCYTSDSEWQADPLLRETSLVRDRMRNAPPSHETFDIHIRNTWPPSTRDMVGKINAYVCFAWEESEFPAKWVERFNRDLDLVMVASTFVKRALEDSGVTIPVEVVGEGADHVLSAASPLQTSPATPRLLHVSSGFARKGVDALIEAYCETFTAQDDVELVLKTFSNPDNAIPKLIGKLTNRDKLPRIKVIEASYSYPDLLSLYQSATAIVAPSRGEGFGLPLAEAMLLGVPVITTNYSGQVDFCRSDNSWLVDYHLAASKAHVSGSFGVWADPDVRDLGQQMKAVLTQSGEVLKRSIRAKAFVQKHLTWEKAAKRTLYAIAKHSLHKVKPQAKVLATNDRLMIDVVSSWGRNCGIATYASHLYGSVALAGNVSAILAQKHGSILPESGPDELRVSRVWGDNFQAMMALAARLERGDADVLWMQHHPGHFSGPDMFALTESLRKSRYRTRVITLHSVTEAARGGSLDWCNAFDIAFVHSAKDAETLSKAGHRNPIVIPHGVLTIADRAGRTDKPYFDIGSFGFLTPHKNVELLVRAFILARGFSRHLRLNLFNCMLQDERSRACRAMVENLIQQYGLDSVVIRNYDFVPEQQLLLELSRCDLFVFPYGETTETATGAARIALSADKPILCSQSPVLRDLHPVSHVLKELTPNCLAEALVCLSQSDELLSLYDHERSEFIQRYSYERAAERYLKHIIRSLEVRNEHRHAA